MRRNPSASRRFRGAMTLIELLVVIVILAIAAAMVIPAMGTTGVLRVQGALRSIVADITFAQSDAIAAQQGRAIMFDATGNGYRIVQVIGSTVSASNTLYDPSRNNDLFIVDMNLKEYGGAKITSASFGSSGSTLIFDDMGTPITTGGGNTPSTGGKIVITAQDSVHEIVIDGYTGRITVRRTSGG